MKTVFIFDMDGVLVCSQHRYELKENQKIDLQHWIDNEHKHVDDSLLPHSLMYKQALIDQNSFVIIATARDLTQHNQIAWIDKNLGYPDALVSRQGRKDTRPGVLMKTEGILGVLNEYGLTNAKKYMFEDNKDYLLGVCQNVDAIPRFVQSKQGY